MLAFRGFSWVRCMEPARQPDRQRRPAPARLPRAGDNAAIATRHLRAGAEVDVSGRPVVLRHDVPEGHRFAVTTIRAGDLLRSWGLPFGAACRDIAPGEHLCNGATLEALREHGFGLDPSAWPNFVDRIERFELDERTSLPAPPLPRACRRRRFLGYSRPAGRGVGTRNHLVLLAVTSRVNGFVRLLESRLAARAAAAGDGVVAVTHTEGGGSERPNNLDLVLRALSGFMVHPNVGAVLAVDDGAGVVTNGALRVAQSSRSESLDGVPHAFFSLGPDLEAGLEEAERLATTLLEPLRSDVRSPQSVAHLALALQCGGSDAFSGISGNPLAGFVAREVIRHGGAANIAETDELIGGEAYFLAAVRDAQVAQRFLALIERFQQRAAWHGATAEGNPSAGNRLRGLYNIALKSIGAALKRHPDVRLEAVLEYAERLEAPGLSFMDSPGNDLESIAGQVASGCNLIVFVTGNGSITNFPFVPTLKVVTTSQRFALLGREMDVDAGGILRGAPLEALGARTFERLLEVASGTPCAGERAGHAQVQLWRDWPQRDASALPTLLRRQAPQGTPLPAATEASPSRWSWRGLRGERGVATDGVGLVLPASLCAAQVARVIAETLDASPLAVGAAGLRSGAPGVARFLALLHTEGCGVSGGPSEELFMRTLLGYAVHPMVRYCLLLEHGCEKTHNGVLRARLEARGLDPARFGWASIQAMGGIAAAGEAARRWFAAAIAADRPLALEEAGLGGLRLGIAGTAAVGDAAAVALSRLTRLVVGAGGSVVHAEAAELLRNPAYLRGTLGARVAEPTLAYGESFAIPGFHVMATPNRHWTETLTGLGATGVEVVLGLEGGRPQQAHPLVPVLRVAQRTAAAAAGFDLVLDGDDAAWTERLLERISAVADGRYAPAALASGDTDLQVTRGELGISL
jgi:altronate dehydratase